MIFFFQDFFDEWKVKSLIFSQIFEQCNAFLLDKMYLFKNLTDPKHMNGTVMVLLK